MYPFFDLHTGISGTDSTGEPAFEPELMSNPISVTFD